MKKYLKIFIYLLILSLLAIFFSRLISPREIDDVNPNLNCEQEYLKKSQILWVIPYFEEIPISENQKWCKEILYLNKTLGLHGYRHTYREFGEGVSLKELQDAKRIFYDCFGFYPETFKAPQLNLSKENKNILKNQGIKIKSKSNQIFSKVYHCNDSGTFPNKFHDIF